MATVSGESLLGHPVELTVSEHADPARIVDPVLDAPVPVLGPLMEGVMTRRFRERILRFHATYLGVAAAAGLVLMDIPAIFFGTGPEAPILQSAPFAGIGFLEAHGLALIIAILLWQAPSTRLWHVTGFATSALLGAANLLLWEIFVFTGQIGMGYVATGLHVAVALLQLAAAIAVARPVPVRPRRSAVAPARVTRARRSRIVALARGQVAKAAHALEECGS